MTEVQTDTKVLIGNQFKRINRTSNIGAKDLANYINEAESAMHKNRLGVSDFNCILEFFITNYKWEEYDWGPRDKESGINYASIVSEVMGLVKKSGKDTKYVLQIMTSLRPRASTSKDLVEASQRIIDTDYNNRTQMQQGKCEHSFRENGNYCPRCGIHRNKLRKSLLCRIGKLFKDFDHYSQD